MNTSAKIALVAMLALSAGCAKKKPAVLPPPPPSTSALPGDGTGAGAGSVGSSALPGSTADFAARAGSDRVLFVTDSYDIDATAAAVLDAQARWLVQYPNVKITLEGHCDERGTREYNLALGDRRANSAKNYLAGKGVAPSRITTISYGKERPAASGSDEGSWAQNRRAVTVLVAGTTG